MGISPTLCGKLFWSDREKRAFVVFSAMDSSQMFGGTEECQSSESGWTMYIGSPIYGGDDDDDDGDEGHSDNKGDDDDDDGDEGHSDNKSDDDDDDDDDDDGKTDADQDDDSDDSMASDASSRPSHAWSANKKEEKYGFDKKANKQQQEKQKAQKMKEEKDQKMFRATKAEAPSQSGAKGRKNIWMGKRK